MLADSEVNPAESLYLDDNAVNVEAARAIGFVAEVSANPEQTIERLKKL